MAETISKKEREKKKAKKKQDKAERKDERKVNNDKGKSLEEMTVYLDEYGDIADPSGKPNRQKYAGQSTADNVEYTGVISLLFVDKGYGFITEEGTRTTIFVHSTNFTETLQEKDKVTFLKEKTPKGYSAIKVKKIK